MSLMETLLERRLKEAGFTEHNGHWFKNSGLLRVKASLSGCSETEIFVDFAVSSTICLEPIFFRSKFFIKAEIEDTSCIKRIMCELFKQFTDEIAVPLCEQAASIAMTGDI